jgi:hypothetical protein
VHNL